MYLVRDMTTIWKAVKTAIHLYMQNHGSHSDFQSTDINIFTKEIRNILIYWLQQLANKMMDKLVKKTHCFMKYYSILD